MKLCVYLFHNNLIYFTIIFIIFFNWKNIRIFSSFINNKNEIGKIENHYKHCAKLISYKLKKYNQLKSAKISIISPIYNRKSYIIRFIRNIQYQNFQKLEIILVDDCSIDNTIELIEYYSRKDRRIILIKQKKRKGTFFTRNIGALYSKGKYIFIPDPDDIINKNILSLCYKFSETYNYDIIRFNVYQGNNIINYNIKNKLYNIKIIQPKLSTSLFYENNELEKYDRNTYNKLIKKEIYIISLNSLNKYYYKIYMTLWEDQLMNLILYRTAKSLYFLNKIGYYHFTNSLSITNQEFHLNKFKTICQFLYLKYIFEYSKNIKYEKDMVNFQITIFLRNFESFFNNYNYNYNYNFFLNIINMFISSKFISNNNKYTLLSIKKKLIKKKLIKLNKNVK